MSMIALKRLTLCRQQGVTLLEVMIAVLVISVGLLALAGMNVATVRGSNISQLRTHAGMLAANFADRVRAIQAGFFAGNYANVACNAPGSAPTPTNPCDAPATCTAAQWAAEDIIEWQFAVVQALPQGQGRASCNFGSGCQVQLRWVEANEEGANVTAEGTSEHTYSLLFYR